MVKKGKTVDEMSYMIQNDVNKTFHSEIDTNLKKIKKNLTPYCMFIFYFSWLGITHLE